MKGIASGPGGALRARRWDVIVLGGALPGLVAAARLGMQGARVLVVEEEAAARGASALREPFLLAGHAAGGVLDACLKALTIPLIDRKKIEPEAVALQVVMPDRRVDVGEPQTTLDELVTWGIAKPEEAHELVRALLEAAAAERAAMLEAPVVKAGGLRALARGGGAPRGARHGRGLPVEVARADGALALLLEAQVRALSQLGASAPPPEARARLLGSPLEGGAFYASADGFLRSLLRRRIQAVFGEFRTIPGRFELVTSDHQPGLAIAGSNDVWLGRALVLNAPRSSLAAALADGAGAPDFLTGPAPTRRRIALVFRVRGAVLPEGMARRVVRVLDPALPIEGTNCICLSILPAPKGSEIRELVASAIVPTGSPHERAAAEACIESAVRELMPFSEGHLVREAVPEVRWDEEAPEDPAIGEGWPLDVEIRVASRPLVYALPREAVAALGFEGDVLLGWRAGDAIRADFGAGSERL
ncbi:MAG TPA: hypothetical protein VMW35_10800 [Myxococcota bacterium]|jgi:hypothetical protein|nr:hypothetical protein [Myxococcota bacterium]